jgi:hypothetical protein
LQPFENWVLTLEYTGRYFRFIATKTNDIPELIGQTVRLIDEFFAQLPIEDKQTRNEQKFLIDLCDNAAKVIHEKCVSSY